MKTQHTPGQWSVASYGEQLRLVIKRGKLSLAEILTWSDGPESRAEATANARLIAAAPDLLAALEKALASIEGQAELLRHCGAAYGIGATLAQARAAIAKATGGVE